MDMLTLVMLQAFQSFCLHDRLLTHIVHGSQCTECDHNHTVQGISRVGQNRKYTYIYTVYLVISKPKLPYEHRIYIYIYGSGQP